MSTIAHEITQKKNAWTRFFEFGIRVANKSVEKLDFLDLYSNFQRNGRYEWRKIACWNFAMFQLFWWVLFMKPIQSVSTFSLSNLRVTDQWSQYFYASGVCGKEKSLQKNRKFRNFVWEVSHKNPFMDFKMSAIL